VRHHGWPSSTLTIQVDVLAVEPQNLEEVKVRGVRQSSGENPVVLRFRIRFTKDQSTLVSSRFVDVLAFRDLCMCPRARCFCCRVSLEKKLQRV
jgi:hypothetical protein